MNSTKRFREMAIVENNAILDWNADKYQRDGAAVKRKRNAGILLTPHRLGEMEKVGASASYGTECTILELDDTKLVAKVQRTRLRLNKGGDDMMKEPVVYKLEMRIQQGEDGPVYTVKCGCGEPRICQRPCADAVIASAAINVIDVDIKVHLLELFDVMHPRWHGQHFHAEQWRLQMGFTVNPANRFSWRRAPAFPT